MVDKIILELPADTVGGDILVSTETRERAETAAAASEAARNQAQVYAANTVALQDTTFTALIADPESETRAQLNATFVRGQMVEPGNAGLAPGKVIVIGEGIGLPEGINTSGLIGDGAPSYENVIGGILASVNTPAKNLPPDGPGTGAGALVDQNGSWVWILGGYDNVVNGWAVVLHGFHNKVGAGANHITISGGSIHEVADMVQHAVISGGTMNKLLAASDYAVIAGGAQNTASALYAVIGGGINNIASGRSSLVLGGEGNKATANYAVVSGINNEVSGVAAIASGQSHKVTAQGGTATGREHQVDSVYSTAMGRGAATRLPGEVAQAHGSFSLAGDAQRVTVVTRAQSTNATPVPLRLDGAGARVSLPRRSTWAFTAHVAARRADALGESAGFKIEGVIDLQGTLNTVAFVGTPTVTVLGRDVEAWSVAVVADTGGGTGGFDIIATGEAGKTIRWVASIDATQVVAPE